MSLYSYIKIPFLGITAAKLRIIFETCKFLAEYFRINLLFLLTIPHTAQTSSLIRLAYLSQPPSRAVRYEPQNQGGAVLRL